MLNTECLRDQKLCLAISKLVKPFCSTVLLLTFLTEGNPYAYQYVSLYSRHKKDLGDKAFNWTILRILRV